MSEFRDRAAQNRFELVLTDGTAFATYRDVAGARAILHVETPAHLRGRGVAARLMDEIAKWARANGAKLNPRCSYAVAYFERHAEARDVLAG